MTNSDEERRIREWKKALAEDDSDDGGFPDAPTLPSKAHYDDDTSDEDLAEELRKTQLESDKMPPPAGVSQAHGAENFNWDGFEQIRLMEEHNMQLLLVLDEKEKEITRLKELTNIMESSGSSTSRSGDQGAKIVSLAKKNRSLVVSLNKERARVAQLEEQLKKKDKESLDSKKKDARKEPLSSRPADDPQQGDEEEVDEAAKALADKDKQIKELKDKFTQANSKLGEYRQQVHTMKTDYNKMQRCLMAEVGDDISLDKILDEGSGSSGWRGRAQQIGLLKSKIKELKRQVTSSNPSQDGEARSTPVGGDGEKKSFDDRYREDIRQKERDRRQEYEDMQNQLQAKTGELARMKQKADGNAARNRTLENDVKGLREKIKLLLEKAEGDNKLVSGLRKEIEGLKKHGPAGRPAILKKDKLGDGSTAESLRLKKQIAEQERQITRQEKIILSLRADLEQVQEDTKAVADYSVEGEGKMMVMENKKLKELTKLFKEQLRAAEEQMAMTEESLRNERQKSRELESQLLHGSQTERLRR